MYQLRPEGVLCFAIRYHDMIAIGEENSMALNGDICLLKHQWCSFTRWAGSLQGVEMGFAGPI
jgi:hypothetical protein